MSEEQLEQWAGELTGDTIVAAGRFFWRHSHHDEKVGAVAASFGEGAANEYGQSAVGEEGQGERRRGVPGFLVVAVSEAKAYVLSTDQDSPTSARAFTLEEAFDREHLAVKLHRRVGWRLLDLEDTQDGRRLELETGKDTHDAHTKDVVHALAD